MVRITVMLDHETRARLRRIASERGISVAAVIREAIDGTIERHARPPRSLGFGVSGTSGTARLTAEHRVVPRKAR